MRIIVSSQKEKRALRRVFKYIHDAMPKRCKDPDWVWLTPLQDQLLNDLRHMYQDDVQHLIQVKKQ